MTNYRKQLIGRLDELYENAPDGRAQLLDEVLDLSKTLSREYQKAAGEYLRLTEHEDSDEEIPAVVFSAETGALCVLLQYAALGMIEYKTAKLLGEPG